MSTIRSSANGGIYRKTVLKNGLRVVTEKIPSVRSITLGVWIDVGSRNESPDENGLSHLIEHMVFKGTKNRTAKQIASSLESIGGSLNAFTSREQTCYTARILDEHIVEAVDVLADITCRASHTPANLKREKKVVCEEISESLETPSDLIHDLFSISYWGDHPLGRPILGQSEIISQMPRSKMLKYIDRNYRTESIVIAASGSISHEKFVRLIKEKFDFQTGKAQPFESAIRKKPEHIKVKSSNNNQIHLSLGYPGIGYCDADKMTALTTHAFLGGGMSSALFQKIREEKGLAYTVYTYLDLFKDAGVFGAYMATDKTNITNALEIIIKELNRIKKRKLADSVLDKVKAQLKGQLTLGMESTSARMNRMARNELMLNQYNPMKRTLKQIDKVKSSDIMEFANKIFIHDLSTLAVLGSADEKSLKNLI
jgi:predicted Zn-dependent peptidase